MHPQYQLVRIRIVEDQSSSYQRHRARDLQSG